MTCPFAPLPRGHGSWNQPSICHDTLGKNTVKYCFFIPFITLTRLNLEAPLALTGEVQPQRVLAWPVAPGELLAGECSLQTPGPRGPCLPR